MPHTVGMTGGAYLDRLATMGLITREDPIYGGRCSLTESGKAILDKRKP
jgi:DNA-binding MarR family transcriptional regulator